MFDYIRKLFEMLLKNYQQLVETNRDVFGNAYGWMMRGLGSLLTWLGESGLQLLAVVGYVLLVAAAVISSIYTLLLVLGVIFVVARAEESIFKYLWSIKVPVLGLFARLLALISMGGYYAFAVLMQVAAVGVFLPGLISGGWLWMTTLVVFLINISIMRWQFPLPERDRLDLQQAPGRPPRPQGR